MLSEVLLLLRLHVRLCCLNLSLLMLMSLVRLRLSGLRLLLINRRSRVLLVHPVGIRHRGLLTLLGHSIRIRRRRHRTAGCIRMLRRHLIRVLRSLAVQRGLRGLLLKVLFTEALFF